MPGPPKIWEFEVGFGVELMWMLKKLGFWNGFWIKLRLAIAINSYPVGKKQKDKKKKKLELHPLAIIAESWKKIKS